MRPIATSPSEYFGRSALLAALYIVTGKLGLLFAVSPGFATVAWPPSGIALGMLILYNWRLWPGILIGSFLLNCYIAGFNFESDITIDRIYPIIGIAIGSTLQALCGRALVSKFIGLPLSLKNIRKIFWLFVLCSPFVCLIAASIGIISLYLSNTLASEDILSNWLAWWVGDITGILIFMPLTLLVPYALQNGRLGLWRP